MAAGETRAARRPDRRFALSHPANLIALGFGSGLARRAPGTFGTIWAWVVFALLERVLPAAVWPALLGASALIGWWACARCAAALGIADPSSIVWDEVLAFWCLLWLIAPADPMTQLLAFGLFRFFDIVKPGPVGWADNWPAGHSDRTDIGWREGLSIMLDDLVAAAMALGSLALIAFAARIFLGQPL